MHAYNQAGSEALDKKSTRPKNSPAAQAIVDENKRAVLRAVLARVRVRLAKMLLRFLDRRSVSSVTCHFPSWSGSYVAARDKRVLLLFRDNVSWYISREVKDWVRQHNRVAKKRRGLRLLMVRLPKISPWLNNIEANWDHDKRAVVELERVAPSDKLEGRLCRYYRCERLERLTP